MPSLTSILLSFGYHTHTANASQETRTVVEKLSIDVKPKFFYFAVNADRPNFESDHYAYTNLVSLAQNGNRPCVEIECFVSQASICACVRQDSLPQLV